MAARATWDVWSTTAEVSTVDAADLSLLRRIAEQTIDEVDRACSRFRPDAEIARVSADLPQGATVSSVLARVIRDALTGAQLTDGLVDPTLGSLLHRLGWIAAGTTVTPVSIDARANWRDVHLTGDMLVAPTGVHFDFGATGKATASDLIIERALESGIERGALVSLGGDIATTPAAPDRGWVVRVLDIPGDPSAFVALAEGAAVATSSTRRRRLPGVERGSHIIDPRSARPVADIWGSVTAVAGTCVHANSAATAAIVLGDRAAHWLTTRRIAARLLRTSGDVVHTSHWPVGEEPAHV